MIRWIALLSTARFLSASELHAQKQSVLHECASWRPTVELLKYSNPSIPGYIIKDAWSLKFADKYNTATRAIKEKGERDVRLSEPTFGTLFYANDAGQQEGEVKVLDFNADHVFVQLIRALVPYSVAIKDHSGPTNKARTSVLSFRFGVQRNRQSSDATERRSIVRNSWIVALGNCQYVPLDVFQSASNVLLVYSGMHSLFEFPLLEFSGATRTYSVSRIVDPNRVDAAFSLLAAGIKMLVFPHAEESKYSLVDQSTATLVNAFKERKTSPHILTDAGMEAREFDSWSLAASGPNSVVCVGDIVFNILAQKSIDTFYVHIIEYDPFGSSRAGADLHLQVLASRFPLPRALEAVNTAFSSLVGIISGAGRYHHEDRLHHEDRYHHEDVPSVSGGIFVSTLQGLQFYRILSELHVEILGRLLEDFCAASEGADRWNVSTRRTIDVSEGDAVFFAQSNELTYAIKAQDLRLLLKARSRQFRTPVVYRLRGKYDLTAGLLTESDIGLADKISVTRRRASEILKRISWTAGQGFTSSGEDHTDNPMLVNRRPQTFNIGSPVTAKDSDEDDEQE